MKIKKIVALILTCALTISPLNSFAFAENEADLTAEVRQQLKSQLNLSEADKKVLKSKIEDLIQKNVELREKIEKLLAKNKNLNDKVEKLKAKNELLEKKLGKSSNGFIKAAHAIINKIIDAFVYINFHLPLILFGGAILLVASLLGILFHLG